MSKEEKSSPSPNHGLPFDPAHLLGVHSLAASGLPFPHLAHLHSPYSMLAQPPAFPGLFGGLGGMGAMPNPLHAALSHSLAAATSSPSPSTTTAPTTTTTSSSKTMASGVISSDIALSAPSALGLNFLVGNLGGGLVSPAALGPISSLEAPKSSISLLLASPIELSKSTSYYGLPKHPSGLGSPPPPSTSPSTSTTAHKGERASSSLSPSTTTTVSSNRQSKSPSSSSPHAAASISPYLPSWAVNGSSYPFGSQSSSTQDTKPPSGSRKSKKSSSNSTSDSRSKSSSRKIPPAHQHSSASPLLTIPSAHTSSSTSQETNISKPTTDKSGTPETFAFDPRSMITPYHMSPELAYLSQSLFLHRPDLAIPSPFLAASVAAASAAAASTSSTSVTTSSPSHASIGLEPGQVVSSASSSKQSTSKLAKPSSSKSSSSPLGKSTEKSRNERKRREKYGDVSRSNSGKTSNGVKLTEKVHKRPVEKEGTSDESGDERLLVDLSHPSHFMDGDRKKKIADHIRKRVGMQDSMAALLTKHGIKHSDWLESTSGGGAKYDGGRASSDTDQSDLLNQGRSRRDSDGSQSGRKSKEIELSEKIRLEAELQRQEEQLRTLQKRYSLGEESMSTTLDESGDSTRLSDTEDSKLDSGSATEPLDLGNQSGSDSGQSLPDSSKRGADGSTDEGSPNKRRCMQLDERELTIPLEHGWNRQTIINGMGRRGIVGEVLYFAPCGKKMKTIPDVMRYLERNPNSDLGRENFSFNTKVNVGHFFEIRNNQGSTPVPLTDTEVLEKIEMSRGKRARMQMLARKKREKAAREQALARQIMENKLKRRMELQEMSRRASEMRFEKRLERQQQKELEKKEKEQEVVEKRKEKEKHKIMKQQEKIRVQEAMRREREMRAQQIIEARNRRQRELEEMRLADAVQRNKEREMKRQQLIVMKEQERERRRQHLLLLKALEQRKKQEEKQNKERMREEKLNEKIKQRELKMHQRRVEMEVAMELKKPAEDMELKNAKPLPSYPRLKSKLAGRPISDCLMVVEFLSNFGVALNLDKSSTPTLESLEKGLLNESEEDVEEFMSLVMHLLRFALDDVGVPNPKEATTRLNQKITEMEMTDSTMSEVLRIFVRARGEKEMSEWLTDKPMEALNPTKKAAILAFLCNELLTSKVVTGEIDKHMDAINNLRRDKWIVEGQLRQLRVFQARKFNKIHKSTDRRAHNLNAGVLGQDEDTMTSSKHESDDDDDKDEDEEKEEEEGSGNESDGSSSVITTVSLNSNAPFEPVDENLTREESDKRIEKLRKQHAAFRQKVFRASLRLRAINVGQDRYKRTYWVLPLTGGVYVEGMESGVPQDYLKEKELKIEKEEENGEDEVKKEVEDREKMGEGETEIKKEKNGDADQVASMDQTSENDRERDSKSVEKEEERNMGEANGKDSSSSKEVEIRVTNKSQEDIRDVSHEEKYNNVVKNVDCNNITNSDEVKGVTSKIDEEEKETPECDGNDKDSFLMDGAVSLNGSNLDYEGDQEFDDGDDDMDDSMMMSQSVDESLDKQSDIDGRLGDSGMEISAVGNSSVNLDASSTKDNAVVDEIANKEKEDIVDTEASSDISDMKIKDFSSCESGSEPAKNNATTTNGAANAGDKSSGTALVLPNTAELVKNNSEKPEKLTINDHSIEEGESELNSNSNTMDTSDKEDISLISLKTKTLNSLDNNILNYSIGAMPESGISESDSGIGKVGNSSNGNGDADIVDLIIKDKQDPSNSGRNNGEVKNLSLSSPPNGCDNSSNQAVCDSHKNFEDCVLDLGTSKDIAAGSDSIKHDVLRVPKVGGTHRRTLVSLLNHSIQQAYQDEEPAQKHSRDLSVSKSSSSSSSKSEIAAPSILSSSLLFSAIPKLPQVGHSKKGPSLSPKSKSSSLSPSSPASVPLDLGTKLKLDNLGIKAAAGGLPGSSPIPAHSKPINPQPLPPFHPSAQVNPIVDQTPPAAHSGHKTNKMAALSLHAMTPSPSPHLPQPPFIPGLSHHPYGPSSASETLSSLASIVSPPPAHHHPITTSVTTSAPLLTSTPLPPHPISSPSKASSSYPKVDSILKGESPYSSSELLQQAASKVLQSAENKKLSPKPSSKHSSISASLLTSPLTSSASQLSLSADDFMSSASSHFISDHDSKNSAEVVDHKLWFNVLPRNPCDELSLTQATASSALSYQPLMSSASTSSSPSISAINSYLSSTSAASLEALIPLITSNPSILSQDSLLTSLQLLSQPATPSPSPTPCSTPGLDSGEFKVPPPPDMGSYTDPWDMLRAAQGHAESIPKNKQHGWWRIHDTAMLRSVMPNTLSRGIREKSLQRSIHRYLDYAKLHCSFDSDKGETDPNLDSAKDKKTEKSDKEEGNKKEEKEEKSPQKKTEATETKENPAEIGGDETQVKDEAVSEVKVKKENLEEGEDEGLVDEEKKEEKPVCEDVMDTVDYVEPDGIDSWSRKIMHEIEMGALEEVEALEERIFQASLQAKQGWRPNKDTNLKIVDRSVEQLAENESYPLNVAISRLLELEANIERRYMKPPLNRSVQLNLSSLSSHTDNDRDVPPGLSLWRQAVASAKSPAQLSLCTQLLAKSISWEKSIMKVTCQICRKDDNEAELLLCDGCDKGYHTYCFKPKMENIPDGDWYCYECVSKASGTPHCVVCGVVGGKIVSCIKCPRSIHLDCLDPPLPRMPKRWHCTNCVMDKGNSKRSRKRKESLPTVQRITVTKLVIKEEPQDLEEFSAATASTSTSDPVTTTSPTPSKKPKTKPNANTESIPALPGKKKRKRKEKEEETSTPPPPPPPVAPSPPKKKEKKEKKERKPRVKKEKVEEPEKAPEKEKEPEKVPEPEKAVEVAVEERRSERCEKGNNKDLTACGKLLMELEKHECGWPFLKPVNKKQFPSYKKYIKFPMDFSSAKTKLKNKDYKHRQEFAADMRLIFNNCETFNEDESEVGQAGFSLRQYFERRWLEIFPDDGQ